MASEQGAAGTQFPSKARASITLKDGEIVVQDLDAGGEVVRVGNGGAIHWICPEDGPIQWWAIVMKTETPFDGDDGWAASNRGRQGITRIRQDAHGGGKNTRRYEYAIVASDGRQVYFRDPEVEVGPIGGP